MYYQERLIDSTPTLLDLKKSLLFLSSSSWGQILEERKLAGKCSYPPCSNPSPSVSGAGGRGKFRISLRNKSVKAVEDLDLGEAGNTWDDLRDYFCGKGCYARSEWILRWVLSEKGIGLLDSNGDRAKGRGAAGAGGGGGGSVLGGKWQKLTSHPHGYEQVELLEDIERESGVDIGEAESEDVLEGLQQSNEQEEELAEGEGAERVDSKVKDDSAQISKLMGDLTIIERSKTTSQTIDSITTSSSSPAGSRSAQTGSASAVHGPITTSVIAPSKSSKPLVPSRTVYDVDVPNSFGARFTGSHASKTTFNTGEDEEEDDMDLRERELSHILRFASLAPASRPRPRNTTIRFDNSPAGEDPHAEAAEEGGEHDEPVLDAQEAKERSEIRRIMDLALDVRADQRELGLLD